MKHVYGIRTEDCEFTNVLFATRELAEKRLTDHLRNNECEDWREAGLADVYEIRVIENDEELK